MSTEVPRTETMPFAMHLGYTQTRDGAGTVGRFEPARPLLADGTDFVRPAVLLTIADIAIGSLANLATDPKLAMTLDLAVHGDIPASSSVAVAGVLLKASGSVIIGETWFTDSAAGRVLSFATGTFVVSPRPSDVRLARVRDIVSAPGELQGVLSDDLGITVDGPGVARVQLRPYVAQSAGALQGGVTALLAEVAAESMATRRVTTLDVRYLSAVRVGPAATSTTLLGPDLARVEVHDEGNDNRRCAMVLAGLAPER